MLTYNIGFKNSKGIYDETQINVNEYNQEDEEIIELVNLIIDLAKEMDIKKVVSIDYLECDNEEED